MSVSHTPTAKSPAAAVKKKPMMAPPLPSFALPWGREGLRVRETLEIINIRDSEFSLNIDNDSSDFILVTINHGYGTAFETEIMDLDYSNFQIQNFTSLASIIPWNDKKIIHNIKLNHLPLNDLNRKKYGIMKTETRVIKTKYLSELLLNNFLKNFEDVHSDSFQFGEFRLPDIHTPPTPPELPPPALSDELSDSKLTPLPTNQGSTMSQGATSPCCDYHIWMR